MLQLFPQCQVNSGNVLPGKKVFIDIDIALDGVETRLAQLSASQVHTRLDADVILVADPAKPGGKNLWAACLLGQVLVSQRMFATGTGPAIHYKPAICSPTKLLFSPEFRQAHPRVTALLEICVAKSVSKWTIVRRPSADCLTLISDQDDRGHPKILGPSRFLHQLCGKPSAVAMGACGL